MTENPNGPDRRMKAARRAASALCLLFFLVVISTSGADGVNTYVYDADGYIVPCPEAYVFRDYLDFSYLPPGPLLSPEDIEAARDGTLYIADTGNSRIVKMTPRGEFAVIVHPDMSQPTGLSVDPVSGDLYVADAGSRDIFRFSASGQLKARFAPPASEVLPENYMYAPSNVVVDRRGWLYVIGTGTSYGIVQLDPEGTFRGFFGANRAKFDLQRAISRLFASEEQKIRLRMQSLRPSSDLYLHDDGFLYAVTESESTNQIRRLNAVGVDTYPPGLYGEMVPMKTQTTTEKGDYRTIDAVLKTDVTVSVPQLTKVNVDDTGIVTVLDGLSSKLFQYDQEGELLFVFGGRGRVDGTFVAARGFTVDPVSGDIYVLEISQNALYVMTPTEFARNVHVASRLYRDGKYEEALTVWAEVAKQDAQYPLANAGIGKALAKIGQRESDTRYLRASMRYYRDAGSKDGYSSSFEKLRYLVMLRSFGWIIGGTIAVIAAAGLLLRLARPLRGRRRLTLVWGVLRHPFRAMEEVKYSYSKTTLLSAFIMLLLYLGAHVLRLYVTQFHFTSWDPANISLGTELVRLVLPWLSWCITNYLVSVLFEGEGRFGQIFCFSAYALAPMVAVVTAAALLSRVLSLAESATMSALQALQWVWLVLLMLLGNSTIHNYSLRKSVGIGALSLVGIVLLWGVAVLLLGLVGTLGNFGFTLVREVLTRAF